jgi:hypothetical protein
VRSRCDENITILGLDRVNASRLLAVGQIPLGGSPDLLDLEFEILSPAVPTPVSCRRQLRESVVCARASFRGRIVVPELCCTDCPEFAPKQCREKGRVSLYESGNYLMDVRRFELPTPCFNSRWYDR